MKIAGALFGFLILGVVFVFWFRAYRSIKGDDDGPLFTLGNRKPKRENNSLNDFIAAYTRGEVVPVSDIPPVMKPATAIPPAAAVSPAAPPPSPPMRGAFLSGATKLAYLACKTGLRDHHIFAHVPLSALSDGSAIDPALARAGVDLLICNAAMAAVAAIDLTDAGNSTAHAPKSDYLKALNIRYLRLSAKSLPRPDALHALLYKM